MVLDPIWEERDVIVPVSLQARTEFFDKYRVEVRPAETVVKLRAPAARIDDILESAEMAAVVVLPEAPELDVTKTSPVAVTVQRRATQGLFV